MAETEVSVALSGQSSKPTVGRILWFYRYSPGQGHKGPLAAIVTKVWSERLVNLSLFSEEGNPCGISSVPLIQANDEAPEGSYCTWPTRSE